MENVLVTGVSSGIGRAVAVAFCRRGYRVIAGARNIQSGIAGLEDLVASGSVRPVQLDVTSSDSIQAAIADIRGSEGHIDVLVNNAGISTNAPLEFLPEDDHKLTFETNYWGPVRLMQAVVPMMRERRKGLIINMSSMMPHFALAGTTAYASSKAALEMASEIVAIETRAFDIRVVVVKPGVVTSQLQTNTSQAGRWMPPDATPYADVFSKTRSAQQAILADPLDADEAANQILDTCLCASPPFRVLIGKDANVIVPARKKLSDEDWIAIAAGAEGGLRQFLKGRSGLSPDGQPIPSDANRSEGVEND